MQVDQVAIEFETDVHNNTIQIPIEYKELEAKHISLPPVNLSPYFLSKAQTILSSLWFRLGR
jgi:hypothetical protein